MDIAAIASRFADMHAQLMRKSMSTLEKERKGFADKHKNAAVIVKRLKMYLEEIAIKPSGSDKKALEDAGIAVKVLKTNTFRKCLDGYEVVSDLRGQDPEWYSNGLVLEKDGKTFYASAVDHMDFQKTGDESPSAVERFTTEFSRMVGITKLASEKGLSLPIVETFACFHTEGYTGYIVFQGKESTKTWNDHVYANMKGNMYTPKNRAVLAGIVSKLGPVAKRKMDKLHDAGIIFAFHGYDWIDTSGIVIDFDASGKPVDIFPLNYSSSVTVSDVVTDSILKDYEIIDRLQRDGNEKREKETIVSEIIAMNLIKEGLIKA
eukprot:jgi/Tetstr1/447240/TSEL_034677.t1